MRIETKIQTDRTPFTRSCTHGSMSATGHKIAVRQSVFALERWESEGGAVHAVR
jgi:hypothetical protein